MVKIKNATTNGKDTFIKINTILTKHGVTKIMYDYSPSGDGSVDGITFGLNINGNDVGFKMPALVDNVFAIMYPNGNRYSEQRYLKSRKEQAYKTAWSNIKDWIDAQMALIDTQQVKIEQVFLPYMITGQDQTLYDQINESKFKLLQ